MRLESAEDEQKLKAPNGIEQSTYGLPVQRAANPTTRLTGERQAHVGVNKTAIFVFVPYFRHRITSAEIEDGFRGF